MNPYLRLLKNNAGRGTFRAEAGTIWLYDVIASDREEASWFGGIAPEDFIAQLRAMSGPVLVRVNSPGGSVMGAQAIVAAMREYGGKITCRVDALAASAASVIAAEAAEVEIAQGALMMIHRAWGLQVGNAEDMQACAALLEKLDGQIAASYARRAGSDHDWAAMMAAETWFDAEEAVAYGLADRVLSASTQRDGVWDLSAYKCAPWQPAPADASAPGAVDHAASDALQAELTGNPADEISASDDDRKAQDRARRQLAVRLKF